VEIAGLDLSEHQIKLFTSLTRLQQGVVMNVERGQRGTSRVSVSVGDLSELLRDYDRIDQIHRAQSASSAAIWGGVDCHGALVRSPMENDERFHGLRYGPYTASSSDGLAKHIAEHLFDSPGLDGCDCGELAEVVAEAIGSYGKET